ncbi:hypothetical protein HPB48_022091 [Haemaphysalis longicornis]|uniref:Reverse transcriptase domain-containing protein n=1 Tax=Haemaphysalis longicornis TaxID=44386 RepID=A0A9J6GQE3_HAELO|nr:hypothetical protein HPB48_022091 [Haemaphysalis longicornis]
MSTKDIQSLREEHEILLVGDFNAHIEDLGDRPNASGNLLLGLAEDEGLVIGNLTGKCTGRVTWAVRDLQSCIDYCLMSEGLYAVLDAMIIHEDGKGNLGSDHNRIVLTFRGHSSHSRRQGHRQTRLNERQLQEVADQLETRAEEITTYAGMMGVMRDEMSRQVPLRARSHCPKAWWNAEVAAAIQQRREASRLHRHLNKAGDPEATRRAWETFLDCKRSAAALVQTSTRGANKQFMEDLKAAGRQAPKRFWQKIKRDTRMTTGTSLRAPEGNTVEGKDCLPVWNNWLQSLQAVRGPPEQQSGCTDLWIHCSGKESSQEGAERAVKKVSPGTAPGCDGVLMGLVKVLGPLMCRQVGRFLTETLKKAAIPEEWSRSLLRPLYKGAGDKTYPMNYMPIAVTPVLYRMAMQVVRERLQGWAEWKGLLGELQMGFRAGRRIDDCLYVLTQCMEIAQRTNLPLYVALLDISKAYDSVDRELLWTILDRYGLEEKDVDLLRAIYANVTAQVVWEGHTAAPVEGSGQGFRLEHKEGGQTVVVNIPALVYADDFAVLAGSPQELQQLLETCAMGITERHLVFNPAKCVVMAWGVGAQQTAPTWRLQGATIHLVQTAKYLGVRLTTGTSCYLAEHESELKARASRSKGMLEVTRALWKFVAVPGITYGNAVLCLSSGTREFLERCQRWVGRLALGTHGQCTTETVQGDMGWSTFAAREAVAKASYENRLLRLPVTNVARQTLLHTIYASQPTRWAKRTRALRDRFGLPAATLVTVNPSREVVRAQVQRSEKAEWRGLATAKPSLEVYCTHKEDIRRETLFDNSRGSGLLAEARGGVLRTGVWRARFTTGLSTTCALCGGAEETIAHVVVNCPDILPAARTTAVHVALCFAEEETETERGEVVEVTKRRLEHWWSHGALRRT